MQYKDLLLIGLLLIIFSLPFTLAYSDKNANKERFIVKTTDSFELKDFKSKGCEVKYVFKFSSALDCPSDIGISLGLQKDIKVFAVDAAANTQIGADLVHTQGLTGSGRRIVVLDTGIDSHHPELADSYDPTSKCFISGCNSAEDDNGHGTFVSGLITANGLDANAKGTAPSAIIWAGKILDSSGGGYISDIIAAINYVTANVTADAISMSLGTAPPYTYRGSSCDGVVPDLDNAIHNAVDAGISVVAAAGNSGGNGVSIPGCISDVITVGAVNINDVRASFSGIGNSLDVVALGVNDYSTVIGSSYGTGSGTSFSTPIVSAVIALMEQKNPTITPTDVTNILRSTALDLGSEDFDRYYGYGRVVANAAVDTVPGSVAPVHDVAVFSISAPSSAVQGSLVNIDVNVKNEGNQPESFTVTVSDETDSVTIGSQAVSLNAGASTILSFIWATASSTLGAHSIKAQASVVAEETDTADNVKTVVITINPPDTTPPVISNVQASSITQNSATITWATDELSDSVVRYGTSTPPTTIISNANLVTSHSITLTGLSSSTTYFFEVQSTDSSGNAATENNGGLYYSFTTPLAPPASVIEFSDSFEAGTLNKWIQDAQKDWFVSTHRARDGSRSAEVDGFANDATITMLNAVNLAGKSSATLTFSWFIESNWDSGEYICLDIFSNGVWNNSIPGTARCLDGNVDAENVWHDISVGLGSYLTSDFKIRFRAKVSNSKEDGDVDKVVITSVS